MCCTLNHEKICESLKNMNKEISDASLSNKILFKNEHSLNIVNPSIEKIKF